MSSGPDNVTTTTSSDPPDFLVGPLTNAVNAASNQFNVRSGNIGNFTNPNGQSSISPFLGDGMVPGFGTSGIDFSSINSDVNIPATGVSGTAPDLIGGSQNLVGSMLNGDFLSPDSNPYLQQTFDRAADLTQTRLDSEFAGSGRNLSAAQPARSEELQTLASNIYGNNYQQERSRQIGAIDQSQGLDPLNMYINQLAGIIPGAGGSTSSTQPVFRQGLF